MIPLFTTYLKKVYAIWAKCYDACIDPLFKFNRKEVIKQLRITKKDNILEIGVGTGLNLPYYPASCEVTGIDFSAAMLKKAKEKQTKAKLTLKTADARKLPFRKNQFNKALTTYVLRVSSEPKKIVQEVSRVVKKDGLFVVVDQFKGKNKLLLTLLQPLKLLLGWGREYNLRELINGTSWVIGTNKQFGAMANTRLVVLKNKKI